MTARQGSTLIAAAALALLLSAPHASAMREERVGDSPPATPAAPVSPDRVIVEWAAGASATERRSARAEAGVEYARDLGARRFQLVETEPGQTPRDAARELEADPRRASRLSRRR